MKGDKLKLHIAELKHKHHNMELELHELMHNHGDDVIIRDLKKQKLKLKEEISIHEHRLTEN